MQGKISVYERYDNITNNDFKHLSTNCILYIIKFANSVLKF